MKNKYFFFITLFLFSITINGQKSNKPVSIYTFSNITTDQNGFSFLKDKLKLGDYRFVFSNSFDQFSSQFLDNFENIGKNPSELTYDYKRSLDRNLPRKFLLKNDPTRWNLQCPPPNLLE